MNKHPDITDATREAFISAFFKLALRKDFLDITVKEIALIAGYNRTTFYRYFVDFYGLIEYVEDRLIDQFFLSIQNKLYDNQIDDSFFQILLDVFRNNSNYLPVLLDERNRTKFIHRIKERIAPYLRTSAPNTSRNTAIMNIYFSGVFSALAAHLQHPEFLPDDELLAVIRSLFTDWYWPAITKTP